MNLYEQMKAAALAGNNGGGEEPENLFDTEVEVGSLNNQTGQPFDRDKRLRTKDFIGVEAGTYCLTWETTKKIAAFIWYYDENKQFVRTYPLDDRNVAAPFAFDIAAGYIKFLWMQQVGFAEMNLEPGDVANPTLVLVKLDAE